MLDETESNLYPFINNLLTTVSLSSELKYLIKAVETSFALLLLNDSRLLK